MKLILLTSLATALLVHINGQSLAQTSTVPTTTPTSVSPSIINPGETITITADVIDDGRTAVLQPGESGGKYWVSYYNASTNQAVAEFRSYSELYVGTVRLSSAAGVYSVSNKISGTAPTPSDLPPGTYYVRIYLGSSAATKIGNANNSPTFTVRSSASVTTGNVSSNVCQGSSLSVPFSTNGSVGKFIAQLLDGNDKLVADNLSTTGSTSPLTVYLPYNQGAGTYKIRINSGSPAVTGSSSNSFNIRAIPTMSITNSDGGGITFDGNVFSGGAASISLRVNSDSPWSVKYYDPESNSYVAFPRADDNGGLTSASQRWIYPNPTGSMTYGNYYNYTTYATATHLTEFKNAYCSGTPSGSVTINVKPMAISTGNPSPSSICGGTTIKVPITTNGNGSFRGSTRGASFVVQLLDGSGNYKQDLATGGGFNDNFSSGSATFTAVIPDNLPDGTYKTRVVLKNGSPEVVGSASGNFTMTRTPAPAVTAPAPVCQGSASVQLTASGSGTIKWYNSQGGSVSPVQGTDNAGDFQFSATQVINGCESPKKDVTVKVVAKSGLPAVSNSTPAYCQGQGAPPLTDLIKGTDLKWFDVTNNRDLGSSAPSINTGAKGQQVYKVSQDVSSIGCRSDQATITITINGIPEKPTFTNPAPLCQYGSSVALTAIGQSLQWYTSDDKAIGSPVLPATDNTNPQVFKVTQTVNNCTSEKAVITQLINQASDKPVFTPAIYCVNYTAEPLSARTQTQNPKWYLNGSEVSGTTVPPTNEVRVITYQLTQTQSDRNNCPSQRYDVPITVLNTPTAPTVQDLGLCFKVSATTTLDTRVNGQRLKWYDNITGGTGSATVPIPNVEVIGPRSYYVTQTNDGNCEGPRATLTVTVYPIPAAPVASVSGPVCQTVSQPIGPFTATADAGGTLTWYWSDQLTGGPQPPISSATAQPGAYTVAVAQTINGCIGPRTTITQTINKAPDVPTGSDLLLCLRDADKALSATALAGNTLRWYGQSQTGGTASVAAPVIKADSEKKQTYYVSQVDSKNCESLQRLAIQVTVAEVPKAPTIKESQYACLNTPPITLTAVGNNLIWKGTDIKDSTFTAPVPSTSATKVFSYTVSQKLGSCISPSSPVSYTILPLPSAPTVQSPKLACIGQPSFSLTAVGQNPKWYASTADAIARKNAQSQVPIPTDKPLTVTWYATQTDNFGCESAYTPLDVSVSQQVSAQLYGDNKAYFFDSTAVRIRFSGDGPWNITLWNDVQKNNITENPIVVWEKLKNSTAPTVTYALKAISGKCGPGILPAAYTLTIDRLVTEVEEATPTLSLTVSPNPVSNMMRVEWSAAARQTVTLRLLSATGHVVWQVDRVGVGAVKTESFQLGNVSAGLYFLQLKGEKTDLIVRKLVKQ